MLELDPGIGRSGWSRRKHSIEQIIGKLRETEVELAQGRSVAEVCRSLGVTEQTYYRWRKEYGGLKMDQAKRVEGPRAGEHSLEEGRLQT